MHLLHAVTRAAAILLRTPFCHRALCAVALTGLLAGCANLDPLPDETRFYTLARPADASSAVPSTEPGATRVGVRVTVGSEYLRRPPIAVRVHGNELRFSTERRWAERVDEGVERALSLALQQRLAGATVAPVASGAAAGSSVVLNVALVACEGTDNGGVLEGYWKIIAGLETVPRATGHFRREKTGWNGEDFGQLAALLGALVDELADELTPVVQDAVNEAGGNAN